MKFMLLMNGASSDFEQYAKWSKEDLQRNVGFMRKFSQELKDAGAFVASEGLAFPQQAKLVRAGEHGEPITDGIFPESKEFLAGYWIIDVENAQEAYNFAARLSASPGPGGKPGNMPVEVRQVMSSHADYGL